MNTRSRLKRQRLRYIRLREGVIQRHCTLLIGTALAGCLFLAIGCGGSGEPRLTADQYVDEADRICVAARAEIEALSYPSLEEDVAPYYRSSLQIARDQRGDLAELRPDDDIRSRHERALELLDAQHTLLQGVLDDIEAGGDPFAFDSSVAVELEAIEQQANVLAERLGLEECGRTDKAAIDSTNPEAWNWRTDFYTVIDAMDFFGDNLDPEPSLDQFAERKLDLTSESERLDAALDRLADHGAPTGLESLHELMTVQIPPIAEQMGIMATAVESRDADAYSRSLTTMRPLVKRYAESVPR